MPEEFPQEITKNTSVPFSIDGFGLYAITVTASCHSRQQSASHNNEMLRVEIDDIKLREEPALDKPQYNTIPPAWNGTELKGLHKTVIFILSLDKGNHTLTFIPTNGARIETWNVKQVTNLSEVSFPLEDKAEDGDKRPFYTFALINTPLHSLAAEVTVAWHFLDGDNVKLIIDTTVEPNTASRLWKNWIWSARPLQIVQGPSQQLKSFDTDLSQGIHYIEFWVDRTPTLHRVVFDFGEFTPKRIPSMTNPEWTKDFADDTEEILLARLLLGEAENQTRETKIWVAGSVLNRVTSSAWPNSIREVILQKNQYDPFKPTDSNFQKITRPLEENTSALRLHNWLECYEIAVGILSGKIPNPTSATHFNGKGVDKEYFMATYIPQGTFLRQIDDTYFYWSPN